VPTHGLYLDDSGTKEYSSVSQYGSANTRYFVFAGPLISASEARRLTATIRQLKLQIFRTEEVEIKSNWLRLDHEREKRYLRRYGLSEPKLSAFVESFYGAILHTDLVLLAGVVDKVHMRQVYGDSAWYPPAIAYEVFIQRAQQEVSHGPAAPGSFSVVIDDMSGATPKGNQYRDNLRRHHHQLKKTGSSLRKGMTFPGLEDILFVNSRRSHLIQAADIVAYNVFRQFRDHGERWEEEGLASLPTYDWFLRLAAKFRQGPSGRLQGFGVVKVPLLNRVPWRVG
jgi:hypothetical protein